MRAESERSELHFQDETHLETNPYLARTWHRKGKQPTVPGVGINRRVTVFGSVEALGRARVELVRAAQDTAGFVRYLELLDGHHQAVQREIYLVLDNGSAHTSRLSTLALRAREDWLHVIWLAKYAPFPVESQGTRVALSQAGCPRASGGDAARLRRWHPCGLAPPRWRCRHHRR